MSHRTITTEVMICLFLKLLRFLCVEFWVTVVNHCQLCLISFFSAKAYMHDSVIGSMAREIHFLLVNGYQTAFAALILQALDNDLISEAV